LKTSQDRHKRQLQYSAKLQEQLQQFQGAFEQREREQNTTAPAAEDDAVGDCATSHNVVHGTTSSDANLLAGSASSNPLTNPWLRAAVSQMRQMQANRSAHSSVETTLLPQEILEASLEASLEGKATSLEGKATENLCVVFVLIWKRRYHVVKLTMMN
jgi:hypothetical protein